MSVSRIGKTRLSVAAYENCEIVPGFSGTIDLTQNAVTDVTARRSEANEIDDYDFLESELFRSTIMSVFLIRLD